MHTQLGKPEDVRKQLGWGQDSIVVISSGPVYEANAYEFMIEAMSGLVDKFPDLLYVIVGRPRDHQDSSSINYLNMLAAKAKKLELGYHITGNR